MPGFVHTGHSGANWVLIQALDGGLNRSCSFAGCLPNRKLAAAFADLPRWDRAAIDERWFGRRDGVREVPFSPVERFLRPEEKEACIAVMADVIRKGTLIYGEHIQAVEARLAEFIGCKHLFGCTSGTDALKVGLLALGLQPGDEVLMPANSFAGTENAVLACGGIPRLVDVAPPGYNLDPDKIAAAIGKRTKVILPVHLYGRMARMAEIREVADRHGIPVFEDGCQAIGATGLGKHSQVTALSFNMFKNAAACGKAGAVLTDDDALAERCITYRYHGFDPRKKHVKIGPYGLNGQIDNIQAGALLVRLEYLALNNFKRAYLALRYQRELGPLQDAGLLHLPLPVEDHVWHMYTIAVANPGRRDELIGFLNSRGVEAKVNYPVLAHEQETPLKEALFAGVHLPVTESLHRACVCLPLFNNMDLSEHDLVIAAVRSFFQR